MGILLFFWLFTAGSCALFTALAARDKGYNESNWGIGGFVFGPLALLAMAAMPDLRSRRLLRMIVESQGASTESLRDFDYPAPKPVGKGGVFGEIIDSVIRTDGKQRTL